MQIKKKIPSKGKVHLVAHGWACMLVAYLTKDLNHQIKSVTFISPMGVHSRLSRWESLVSLPVVGHTLFRLFQGKIWRDDFRGLSDAKFRKFSHNRLETILKANRILHQEGLQQYFEDVVVSDKPLLILLGVQTKRYRQPIHPTFKYWRKEILMVPIRKGEHFLSNERPEEVAAALEKFWAVLSGELRIKS